MDDPDCELDALGDALETIDRAGRWSGRDRLLIGDVRRLLAGLPAGDLTVLDVGAGGAYATARLARRLARGGWRPRLILADLHAGALRIARQRMTAGSAEDVSDGRVTRLVRLDAPSLPFRDGAIDLAVSAATLHHLETPEATRMLHELARVVRIGFSVIDLRRSRLTYAATRCLAATVWRTHPYPRRDGPISVRRAFTAAEARDLLVSAGLEGGVVRARPAWIAIRWVPGGLVAEAPRVRDLWFIRPAAAAPAEP